MTRDQTRNQMRTQSAAVDSSVTHCRRELAAHFKGRGTKETEAALRAHLLVCPSCVRLYERRMLLGSLDPRAPSAQERLGRALGFRGAAVDWAELRAPRGRPRMIWMALAAAGAAVLVWGLGRSTLHRATETALVAADGFLARGVDRRNAPAGEPRFWTYRIRRVGPPVLAERTLTPRDELAFAYSNGPGLPYLMMFGVDEHRHVYWFHPAWPAGAPAPTAIRAAAGAGPHELGEAIHHDLDGRTLTIYAVSSGRALGAQLIEETVRTAPDLNAAALFGPETRWSRRAYEVQP